MKNLLITLSVLALSLSSCRKIIDIELEDGDKKTVIEANLYEGPQTFKVKISETGNFFGDNTPKKITNATVTLNSTALTNLGDGNYELPSFIANVGTPYTLKVTENGNEYESTVIMPFGVVIDTITYEFQEESPFSEEGYITQIEFNDPATINNFYRLEVDISGKSYGTITDLILLDDGFLDGNRIEFPLFGIDVAQLGDVITMSLLSTDESTFTYLEGVDALISGGNGAPPANPEGNFSNGALGNFNVYVKNTKTVVITP